MAANWGSSTSGCTRCWQAGEPVADGEVPPTGCPACPDSPAARGRADCPSRDRRRLLLPRGQSGPRRHDRAAATRRCHHARRIHSIRTSGCASLAPGPRGSAEAVGLAGGARRGGQRGGRIRARVFLGHRPPCRAARFAPGCPPGRCDRGRRVGRGAAPRGRRRGARPPAQAGRRSNVSRGGSLDAARGDRAGTSRRRACGAFHRSLSGPAGLA